MQRKTLRRKSKWERRVDRFYGWVNEFNDAKLMLAAFVFLVSALFYWEKIIR